MLAKRHGILLAMGLLLTTGVYSLGPQVCLAKGTAQSKLELANLLLFNGNTDGAIRALQQAIELDPNMMEAHMGLLNLYFQKPDVAAAIKECEAIIKIKPNQKDIHMILGNLLRAQNNFDEAAKEFQKALESGSDPAVCHNAVGVALLQKGDLDGAHEHLKAALDKKEKFPDAHYAMAIVLHKKGDKAKAIEHIDKAIDQSDKNAMAHQTKGDLLANDNKWKEALAEYQESVKDDANFAQGWASIATAYVQLGDMDKARENFAKARKLNPQDKNILYNLAILLEKNGKVNEALAEFQSALLLENDPMMAAQIRMHVDELKRSQGMQLDVSNLGGGNQFGGGGLLNSKVGGTPGLGPSVVAPAGDLLQSIQSHNLFGVSPDKKPATKK
jgi:Tfp pilus assembly protein PilF